MASFEKLSQIGQQKGNTKLTVAEVDTGAYKKVLGIRKGLQGRAPYKKTPQNNNRKNS